MKNQEVLMNPKSGINKENVWAKIEKFKNLDYLENSDHEKKDTKERLPRTSNLLNVDWQVESCRGHQDPFNHVEKTTDKITKFILSSTGGNCILTNKINPCRLPNPASNQSEARIPRGGGRGPGRGSTLLRDWSGRTGVAAGQPIRT